MARSTYRLDAEKNSLCSPDVEKELQGPVALLRELELRDLRRHQDKVGVEAEVGAEADQEEAGAGAEAEDHEEEGMFTVPPPPKLPVVITFVDLALADDETQAENRAEAQVRGQVEDPLGGTDADGEPEEDPGADHAHLGVRVPGDARLADAQVEGTERADIQHERTENAVHQQAEDFRVAVVSPDAADGVEDEQKVEAGVDVVRAAVKCADAEDAEAGRTGHEDVQQEDNDHVDEGHGDAELGVHQQDDNDVPGLVDEEGPEGATGAAQMARADEEEDNQTGQEDEVQPEGEQAEQVRARPAVADSDTGRAAAGRAGCSATSATSVTTITNPSMEGRIARPHQGGQEEQGEGQDDQDGRDGDVQHDGRVAAAGEGALRALEPQPDPSRGQSITDIARNMAQEAAARLQQSGLDVPPLSRRRGVKRTLADENGPHIKAGLKVAKMSVESEQGYREQTKTEVLKKARKARNEHLINLLNILKAHSDIKQNMKPASTAPQFILYDAVLAAMEKKIQGHNPSMRGCGQVQVDAIYASSVSAHVTIVAGLKANDPQHRLGKGSMCIPPEAIHRSVPIPTTAFLFYTGRLYAVGKAADFIPYFFISEQVSLLRGASKGALIVVSKSRPSAVEGFITYQATTKSVITPAAARYTGSVQVQMDISMHPFLTVEDFQTYGNSKVIKVAGWPVVVDLLEYLTKKAKDTLLSAQSYMKFCPDHAHGRYTFYAISAQKMK